MKKIMYAIILLFTANKVSHIVNKCKTTFPTVYT